MKFRFFIATFIFSSAILPMSTYAAPALDPYTQEHIWLLPHTQPAWFEQDGQGGFYGETTDGVYFSQSVISNQEGIKLHRFNIGTAAIYISDKGTIEAPSDLVAVSMYLSLM